MIDHRAIAEPQWPMGGMSITRPMDTKPYTVDQFTGFARSTNDNGGFIRGQIVRRYQPPFIPPTHGLVAYDPTDVSTW